MSPKLLRVLVSVIAVLIVLISITLVSLSFFNKSKNASQISSELSSKESLLQSACQSAINDYPEWTKSAGDIIIWENPDKKFYFRNSPEDSSAIIDSPAQDSETIADMDFIGKNKIAYAAKRNNGLKIGTFEFALEGVKNQTIYEINEPVSFIDVSPFSEQEFTMFYINKQAFLKYIDLKNSKEETLFETPITKEAKIAVSPKGNYVYLLQEDSLKIFNLLTKEKLYENQSVLSAVWLGDSYLLFSSPASTFIYDIKSKEVGKISTIASAKNLSFSPQSEGVIGYNLGSEGKVINCQNWEVLGALQNGEIKALASEKTAIISKENSNGYWRFLNANWVVRLSENFLHFSTVWNRY